MSKDPKVQGSQGPKDQDISNSHSNTSFTLKKVHLVNMLYYNIKPLQPIVYPGIYFIYQILIVNQIKAKLQIYTLSWLD